jgi:hypothetical protein
LGKQKSSISRPLSSKDIFSELEEARECYDCGGYGDFDSALL